MKLRILFRKITDNNTVMLERLIQFNIFFSKAQQAFSGSSEKPFGCLRLLDRACYGVEIGMECKENFGMEYGRCSEWNGMEDLKNGMEDRLPYFHINCVTQYISKLTTNCKGLPNRTEDN